MLIVVARMSNMTLDTIRTAAIVQGRRLFAALIGLVQALIYIGAIAKVLENTSQLAYIAAYAIGVALGIYLGISIEQRPRLRLPTRLAHPKKGAALNQALLASGYRVAEVHGHIRDGDVAILYVEIPRKHAGKLIRDANAVDDACLCIVNDIRRAQFTAPPVLRNAKVESSTHRRKKFDARVRRQAHRPTVAEPLRMDTQTRPARIAATITLHQPSRAVL